MSITPVQDLRRIVEAVGQLRGRAVEDVEIRADLRLLRVTLSDGEQLLISCMLDDGGKPRLDIDLLHTVEAPSPGQLEVPFEGA